MSHDKKPKTIHQNVSYLRQRHFKGAQVKDDVHCREHQSVSVILASMYFSLLTLSHCGATDQISNSSLWDLKSNDCDSELQLLMRSRC